MTRIAVRTISITSDFQPPPGLALVTLYYLVPLDQPWDEGTAVRLLIGLLVFVGVTAWQIRAIAGSRYPGMRAFEALGLIVPFYLLLFASTYFIMERAAAANFTQPLTRTDDEDPRQATAPAWPALEPQPGLLRR